MNKARILGIILIMIGGVLISIFDNDGIGIISGLIMGFGIGIFLTGKLSSRIKI